jgi:hypothetical protein
VFQGTLCLYGSNKRAQRDISNGVNHSLNRAFMRKLQHKLQWRVNFKTHLTLKSHNVLLQNQIEAHDKSMERYGTIEDIPRDELNLWVC